MSKQWFIDNEPEIKVTLLRNAIIVFSQPFEYAKVLIQLGYEPFVATEVTSVIFRRKYLGLPNILTYVKYIKSVDGILGCYRGFLPRLCYANVYYLVYNKVSDLSPVGRGGGDPELEKGAAAARPRSIGGRNTASTGVTKYLLDLLPTDIQAFVKTLGWDCVSVTIGTTVSYPFHLIAVRTMAQFVGRETKYDSLWGSIVEIFKSEGICGFFKGLVPRLISELLTVVIAGTCVFVVTKRISRKNQQVTNLGGSLVANTFAYQYYVASNNMAVNHIGLAIGSYPYALKYTSWYDCWNTLRREGQLHRASSIIGRAYTGPAEMKDGHQVPVNFQFGPIHPRGLGAFEKEQRAIGGNSH